jgi:hypothetical protein
LQLIWVRVVKKNKIFKLKVDFWPSELSEKKMYMFPVLVAYLEEKKTGTGLNKSFLSVMLVLLLSFKEDSS